MRRAIIILAIGICICNAQFVSGQESKHNTKTITATVARDIDINLSKDIPRILAEEREMHKQALFASEHPLAQAFQAPPTQTPNLLGAEHSPGLLDEENANSFEEAVMHNSL